MLFEARGSLHRSASDTQLANNTVPTSWVVGGKDCTTLVAKQLKSIMPDAKQANIQKYLKPLNNAMREFQISTENRQQAFIAQLAHESNRLKDSQENLNYSVEGLKKTFKKYFKTDELAKQYARKPEKIANYVYANRNGNGSEASGDGWKYRGRGLIQLTGKANYHAVGQALGINLESNPDLALIPQNSARIAAYFWYSKGLNKLADQGNLKKITKIINGGLNGYDDRLALYQRAKQFIDCDAGSYQATSTDSNRALISDADYSLGVIASQQMLRLDPLVRSSVYDVSWPQSQFSEGRLTKGGLAP